MPPIVVDSCCTKPSAKTSAALGVTVAEGARSAEAEPLLRHEEE
jgi:hypothetical protein